MSVASEEIKIQRIDQTDPPEIPYHNKQIKTIISPKGIKYISRGFQIIRKDENGATIRETYRKELNVW